MKDVLRVLWRGVRGVLLALLAVILFIEEWGWRPLTAWAARLATWAPLARMEAWLRTLSPKVALALFAVPAVALFPVKLLALWVIHKGHAALGLAVIVAAKLLGTALVGRLFIVVESQLMQIAWVARALGWWRATRQRVIARVHASWPWRVSRAWGRVVRRWARRLMRREGA